MAYPKLEDLIRHDNRYALEAYEFVFAALSHTQQMLARANPESDEKTASEKHVTGQQLLYGIRDLALREFGLMARTVFRQWGINSTDDFGEIVFNLIEVELMSRTDRDTRADFHNVYDLDEALSKEYHIEIPKEGSEHG
jgi:uncharacterized repeat protein (TIGR04138 family)